MKKNLLILLMLMAGFAHTAKANDCSIKIELSKVDMSTDYDAIKKLMKEALAKKGYIATDSGEAEYNLSVDYGYSMTETSCYVYMAHIKIMNSGMQLVADGSSETGILRELLAARTIPRAMTLKAFKKTLLDLPVCR